MVYPEGTGPEDFQDLEQEETQTPQSPGSQQTSKRNSGTLLEQKPTDAPSRQSSVTPQGLNEEPPCVKSTSMIVNASSSLETSLRRSTRQSRHCDNDLPTSSSTLEDLHPLDKRQSIPTSSSRSKQAEISLKTEAVTPQRSPPTDSKSEVFSKGQSQPDRTGTPSRPVALSSSSPLSTPSSSPLLSPEHQLVAPLTQSDRTGKDPGSTSTESCPTINPETNPPLAQQAQQRDETTSASSQSDNEPTNLDSSQTSSRALRNLKGRDLFDSMIWTDAYSTSIFYMFISSFRKKVLYDVKSTSPTHKFLRTLRDGGRLVRNYTQNIDCLEEREGLATDLTLGPGSRSRFHSKTQREPRPSDVGGHSPHSTGVECVQLHGSVVSLRCGLCSKISRWDEAERESTTLAGKAPDCPSCTEYNAKRTGRGRRGLAVGRLRPDIVLYGEEHPNANLVAPLITHDLGLGPDVLLILGTSLRVHGLKVMVKEFAKAVHMKGGKVIFVNRTKPPESTWGDIIDYWVEWDCDAWVLDLKERRGDIWLPQGSQMENRRESAGEPKPKPGTKKASRPKATRDDKMNGVYQTFKILDLLGSITAEQGQQSGRPMYWEKPVRTSTAPIPKTEPAKKGSKARPAQRGTDDATKTNKKRKPKAGSVRDENYNPEHIAIISKKWEALRATAPSLPAKVPESVLRSGRVVLEELKANIPNHLKHYNFSFTPGENAKNTFSYLPNLPGLSLPVEMNLITHPPSGISLPLHSPTTSRGRTADHPSNTRSARHFSSDSTLIVDSECSAEDTIVVAPPPTPNTKRIKRMGSLGTILSSPPEIYHDAEEALDEGSSQEYHDALE